jgi:hypothetical protein
MKHRQPLPRRRPLQAQREGNVAPLTTLDRHTGRVALGAADGAETRRAAATAGTKTERIASVGGAVPGAGLQSNTLPLWGRGVGQHNAAAEQPSDGAAEGGSLFPRYSENKCSSQPRSPERAPWLAELKLRTRRFRAERSMRFRGRARLAFDRGEHSRARWNLQHAQGQQYRFETVNECGERELVVSCGDCGHEAHRLEARCGHFRLCVVCRGHRARRYRAMIRVARRRALDGTSKLRAGHHRSSHWRERFITLTMPHSGDVVRDLRVLPQAWRWFRRRLWLFFRHEHCLDSALLSRIAFVRVIEVTPGTANDGHAHLHVYALSPFTPHEVIRHLWGAALRGHGYATPRRALADVLAEAGSPKRRAQLERVLVTRRGPKGVPLSEVDWPVIDVRECRGNVENELVKYLVKDAELEHGKLNLIDPELYALVYEGLEGVRTVATSRHFFVKEDRLCACDQCGSARVTTRVAPLATPSSDRESKP